MDGTNILRGQHASFHLVEAYDEPLAFWRRTLSSAAPSSFAPTESAQQLEAAADAADERLVQRLWDAHAALRYVPPHLPQHIRVAVALERQLPSLLELQRRVRTEVLAVADARGLAAEAEATLALKRVRKQRQPREQREADKVERKRQIDLEARRKRRRDEFLSRLLAHSTEFKDFHREARKTGAKLAKSVLANFDSKARKETKERERAQRERLRALRENNIDEYMQLIADTKNERITKLLDETDRYLRELGAKVQEQKGEVAGAVGVAATEPQSVPPLEPSDSFGTSAERSSYYKLAHAVDEGIEQPRMLRGGQLKEYQLQGLRWMVSLHNNNLNGILADEMGLGKTIQTIALLTFLVERKSLFGPFMVIVPLAVLSNWQLEFRKWAPELKVVIYKGNPEVRREIFEVAMHEGRLTDGLPPFNVVVSTYELVMKDKVRLKKFKYKYIIIDEGHRMKNAASKLSASLLQYEAQHRILLTGTPLQNSLHELWALLNFLLPKIFSSAESFEAWFSAPLAVAAGGGSTSEDLAMSEEESLLVINRLHQVLRPFLLRRLKSEVEAQLPGKAEYVVKCELSAMQRLLYRQIQEQGLCSLRGGQLKVSGLNNVEMQLRKVCNHPYLFYDDEQIEALSAEAGPDLLWRASGKFELLERILPKLKALGHRVLIFSQMVNLMNLLERYLDYRGYSQLRLDGTTKGDDRGGLLAEFNREDSPYFIFSLSTRAGGLGLNLQTADTVIIFDSDWNPQIDLQAMARAHRIGQKQEVRVLRLVTASPIEEKILATANEKLNSEAMYIEAGKFNQTSDASERREMLQRLIAQSADEDEDAGIPTDAELNVLLARPNPARGLTQEQEAEAYRQLDIAAGRGEEASNGDEEGGGTCLREGRLLTHEELPSWLREAELMRQAAREEGPSEAVLDGPRERKPVCYGEKLSERDFNRMLQSGMGQEEFLSQQRREREQKELREARRKEAGASVDAAAETARKLKRPRAEEATHEEAPAVEADVLKKLINAVANATRGRNKRRLAQLFLQLPRSSEAPDYYQTIESPIAIAQMREKLKGGGYSLAQLDEDVALMVRNAHTYNDPASQVYQDASTLLEVYKEARSRHTA